MHPARHIFKHFAIGTFQSESFEALASNWQRDHQSSKWPFFIKERNLHSDLARMSTGILHMSPIEELPRYDPCLLASEGSVSVI